MSTEPKKRTITLTDRPPVVINEDNWPVVAVAKDHDNQHECQANTVWSIRVRQHDDGRAIVYAVKDSGPGGQYVGFRAARAGEMLSKGEDVCAAIRRVGEAADCEQLVDDCIADLPAEELEDSNAPIPPTPHEAAVKIADTVDIMLQVAKGSQPSLLPSNDPEKAKWVKMFEAIIDGTEQLTTAAV